MSLLTPARKKSLRGRTIGLAGRGWKMVRLGQRGASRPRYVPHLRPLDGDRKRDERFELPQREFSFNDATDAVAYGRFVCQVHNSALLSAAAAAAWRAVRPAAGGSPAPPQSPATVRAAAEGLLLLVDSGRLQPPPRALQLSTAA